MESWQAFFCILLVHAGSLSTRKTALTTSPRSDSVQDSTICSLEQWGSLSTVMIWVSSMQFWAGVYHMFVSTVEYPSTGLPVVIGCPQTHSTMGCYHSRAVQVQK